MKTTIAGTILTIEHAGTVLTFDTMTAHFDNRQYAMMHGFKQRIVDAAAIERARPDGTIKSTDEMDAEKISAMRDMIRHYASGINQWSVREPGDGAESSLTIRGIMRAYGCTDEFAESKVAELMAKKTIDRKKALATFAATERVAKAMAELRAERAKGKVDTDIESLMAE